MYILEAIIILLYGEENIWKLRRPLVAAGAS
jgi:hypothetical protein